MRSNRLLGAHWVCGKGLVAASVALWFFGLVMPVLAQDPVLSSAALPTDPSEVQPSVPTTNSSEHSLRFGQRARVYGHNVFSPETIIGPAFGAGIGQAENEPSGWHQGGEGYGKRFGSGVARHTISETIEFGFAAVDGEDPRYFISQDRSFWGRTRHAIVATFVTETSSGKRIPAFSRFAGNYGAAFISNVWYPDNRATARYAARRGSTALASSVGFHLLREFVPLFRHAPE